MIAKNKPRKPQKWLGILCSIGSPIKTTGAWHLHISHTISCKCSPAIWGQQDNWFHNQPTINLMGIYRRKKWQAVENKLGINESLQCYYHSLCLETPLHHCSAPSPDQGVVWASVVTDADFTGWRWRLLWPFSLGGQPGVTRRSMSCLPRETSPSAPRHDHCPLSMITVLVNYLERPVSHWQGGFRSVSSPSCIFSSQSIHKICLSATLVAEWGMGKAS